MNGCVGCVDTLMHGCMSCMHVSDTCMYVCINVSMHAMWYIDHLSINVIACMSAAIATRYRALLDKMYGSFGEDVWLF